MSKKKKSTRRNTISTSKIVLGLATRGDDIVPSLVEFAIRNAVVHNARFVWKACGWSAQIPQEAVFQEALNLGADYLLMVDSDVTPPIDALDKLLSRNKDLISAPIWHYDVRLEDIHLNVTKKLGQHLFDSDKTGLEKIASSSFGCLLVSRKFLKAIGDSGESFVYWSNMIGDELKTASSDVVLFKKAEKLGFELFVDWDVKGCEHYTKVHLSDRVLQLASANSKGW